LSFAFLRSTLDYLPGVLNKLPSSHFSHYKSADVIIGKNEQSPSCYIHLYLLTILYIASGELINLR